MSKLHVISTRRRFPAGTILFVLAFAMAMAILPAAQRASGAIAFAVVAGVLLVGSWVLYQIRKHKSA